MFPETTTGKYTLHFTTGSHLGVFLTGTVLTGGLGIVGVIGGGGGGIGGCASELSHSRIIIAIANTTNKIINSF